MLKLADENQVKTTVVNCQDKNRTLSSNQKETLKEWEQLEVVATQESSPLDKNYRRVLLNTTNNSTISFISYQ